MTIQEIRRNARGHDSLPQALDDALNMLGQTSKKALLFHLKERYGVSFVGGTYSLEQLFSALVNVLGNGGASVIMERVLQEMGLAAGRQYC